MRSDGSTSGRIPKGMENMDVDIRTPVSVGALVTLAEVWKPAMCQSVEERIKKMRCIYTMECYLVSNRKGILTHAAT